MITEDQWRRIAEEAGMSPEALQHTINDLDEQAGHLHPGWFDRQGDPISFGEWAVLFESRLYRFLADDRLSCGVRVMTIWTGHDPDIRMSRAVLETSVFGSWEIKHADVLEQHHYQNEAQAIAAHDQIVARYGRSR